MNTLIKEIKMKVELMNNIEKEQLNDIIECIKERYVNAVDVMMMTRAYKDMLIDEMDKIEEINQKYRDDMTQLKKLESMIAKNEKIAKAYMEIYEKLSNIE